MGDKIAFNIGERTFGIDIDAVYKILEVDRVFFIPGQSGFINGMVSLMGEPVTVIDCQKALEGHQALEGHRALNAPENAGSSTLHKIIVLRDKKRMVGLDINGANLSFIWKEKITGVHAFLGPAEETSDGTRRFTNGMIEVEDARQVELIDLTAVFDETKKILSEQRDHDS